MTKTELRAQCSQLLLRYRGKQVTGDDLDFLLRVFSYHPDPAWYQERGGGEAPAVWSKRNPEFGYWSDSFTLIYPNGFTATISFRKCITHMPKEVALTF